MGRFTNACLAFGRSLFGYGYDAIAPSNKRERIQVHNGTEDEILKQQDRASLISVSRTLHRNSSIVQWMVERHLDFVSSFTYQCMHPDKGFKRAVEELIRERSKRENADVTGRFRLDKIVRLSECSRTTDGDLLHVHLASNKIQTISGDRIRNRDGADQEGWINGVRLRKDGSVRSYGIYRRRYGGYEWERELSAENAFLHGYFRRGSQYRGISPLASACNGLRDIYTTMELARAKMKVGQIFALALTSDPNPIPGVPDIAGNATTQEKPRGDGTTVRTTKVDFGAGPQVLQLRGNEKAEFLESNAPGSGFLDLHEAEIAVALKCLDLPYSFFDESHTNFVGQLAALQLYKVACRTKRDDNIELLDWHTDRWLTNAVLAGDLTLPRGMTVDQVPYAWIPIGLPWWDKAKQIRGELAAISGGLGNPQETCREMGGEFEHNIDQMAAALEYADEKLSRFGVRLRWDNPTPINVLPVAEPVEAPES